MASYVGWICDNSSFQDSSRILGFNLQSHGVTFLSVLSLFGYCSGCLPILFTWLGAYLAASSRPLKFERRWLIYLAYCEDLFLSFSRFSIPCKSSKFWSNIPYNLRFQRNIKCKPLNSSFCMWQNLNLSSKLVFYIYLKTDQKSDSVDQNCSKQIQTRKIDLSRVPTSL